MAETIKRFTTEYDLREDRIRLSVEFQSGQTRIFWITRRLLDLLVTQLLKQFSASEEHVSAAESASQTPIYGAAIRNELAQQAALSEIEPQAPVRVGPAAADTPPDVLVTTIRLRQGANGFSLVFVDNVEDLAELSMNKTALRQWLAILYKHYQTAGWRDEFWPDWVSPPGKPRSAAHQRLN